MNSPPPSSILNPRRILVRGVNWLGDAVMTTPALLRLRERFPGAHITLLCPEKLRDLWECHPAIDNIISFTNGEGVFSIARHLRNRALRRFWEGTKQVITSERKVTSDVVRKAFVAYIEKSFDFALVFPNSPRSALEVFIARIPNRIGYKRPWRNWFLTQTVASRAEAVKMHKRSVTEIKDLVAADASRRQTSDGRVLTNTATGAHQIYEYLHLVAALGANPEPLAPLLFVKLEEVDAAKKKFGLDQITGPIFGLNPGAEYGPAKRWPVERFIAAAQEIHKRTNCCWLLFGGKSDGAITGQIATALHASLPRHSVATAGRITHHDFSGRTTLRELMALLKCCHVLLTNDTGPMHVAAALGTPVIVPFGSTSPELTGPGLPRDPRHRLQKSDAPCSPCFLRECPIDFRCMNGISVERVVEAVMQAAK